MNKKIRVHYVGGPIGNPNNKELWGGVSATNYIIKRAFENSEKYELVMRPRSEFFTIEEVNLFLESGDVSWLDETSLLDKYFEKGYKRPNILGPLDRSPVKRYNNGEWRTKYTPEWFYNGKLLRLNEAEEKESTLLDEFKGTDYVKNISFIRHAIDLETIYPNYNTQKKYILWAGNKSRPAKNYEMFEEIKKEVEKLGGLPEGYEFMTLNNYVIGDYFKILDETALLINTSKYESFCNAVGEAMSKGVPCLVRENFNGEHMFLDRPIQVKYDTESYAKKILELLNSDELNKHQIKARKYAEENFSLDTMREDIEKVFDEVLKIKNG